MSSSTNFTNMEHSVCRTSDYKIAVVGSRTITDATVVHNALDNFIISNKETIGQDIVIKIVSGGAKGVDSLAESYAKKRNFETIIFKPDWKRYGKSAGFIRNKDIIQTSNCVIVFWDGKS